MNLFQEYEYYEYDSEEEEEEEVAPVPAPAPAPIPPKVGAPAQTVSSSTLPAVNWAITPILFHFSLICLSILCLMIFTGCATTAI